MKVCIIYPMNKLEELKLFRLWGDVKLQGLCAKAKYKNSPFFKGSISWDKLPVNVRNNDVFQDLRKKQQRLPQCTRCMTQC